MEETRSSKVTVPKKYKRYFCQICNIFTNSDNQLTQHNKGVRHQQKKKRYYTRSTGINLNEYECDLMTYVPAFIIIVVTTYVFCYAVVKFVD